MCTSSVVMCGKLYDIPAQVNEEDPKICTDCRKSPVSDPEKGLCKSCERLIEDRNSYDK